MFHFPKNFTSLLFLVGLVLCAAATPAQAFPHIFVPPIPIECHCVAVNPVTNKIYALNNSRSILTVVDGATGVTSTLATEYGLSAVAVNPVTNRVYVLNSNSNYVLVIDGATNTSTTVATGLWPDDVVINTLTNKIYVVNSGGYWTTEPSPQFFQGSVTVIDGATNATTTVMTGASSLAAAVNPVTNKIYVTNYDSNNVTVIDGATNLTTTVAAMTSPIAVAVNPATNKIYVANNQSKNITVIDGASNSTSTVAGGTQPVALAVNQVTNKIYIVNLGDSPGAKGSVTVIDGVTNTTTTVPIWAYPTSIAVNSVTNKIYVVNSGIGPGYVYNLYSVTMFDGATNVPNTVATGINPRGIAVNMTTNKIYVTGYSSSGQDHVTVLDGTAYLNVVEFYSSKLDNYFITADAIEAAAIDNGSAGPGWSRTGNSFRSGGSSAVCRFYGSQSPGPNSHFYTANASECDGLKQLQAATPVTEKRWNFESLDFLSTAPTNGTCPNGTLPVYRAYNNGYARSVDSNHRITTDLAVIQQAVALGWIAEGVVMCAPN